MVLNFNKQYFNNQNKNKIKSFQTKQIFKIWIFKKIKIEVL